MPILLPIQSASAERPSSDKAPVPQGEPLPLDQYVAAAMRKSPPRSVPLPTPVRADQEVAANDAQQQQADQLRAEEIAAEMIAQRKLSEERIRAIWADLQTEFLRIWQEVLLRRQKVMEDLLDKWCKVLFD